MNPTTVRLIVRYAIAAGVGAFAGAVVATYVLHQEQFEAQEDEELADRVASAMENYGPAVDLSKTMKVERVDYGALSKNSKPSLEELVKEKLVETPKREPYLIDFEQFNEDNGYSAVSLTFYALDQTLVDEDEDIIVSPIAVVGTALESYDEKADEEFKTAHMDPDIRYVRSEKDETDYEISRVQKSYKVTVMGEPENPPVDRSEKTGRRVRSNHRAAERKVVKTDDKGDGEGEDE